MELKWEQADDSGLLGHDAVSLGEYEGNRFLRNVGNHTTTRHHMPEGLNPQYQRCEHKTSAIAVCKMSPRMLTEFGLLPRGTESGVWDNRERTAARCDKPPVWD
jgi:hypothetical protein